MENLKIKKNKVGRPPYRPNKRLFIETLKRVEKNEISNVQAMKLLNCKKTLYYFYKKKFGGVKND